MQIKPKLVAVDLDGTIMTEAGDISSRVVSSLKQTQQLGIQVVFVTGRPKRWMWQLQKHFSRGTAIIANGAMLFDLATSRTELQGSIPKDTQLEIFKRLASFKPTAGFAMEWDVFFAREKNYPPRWDDGFDPLGLESLESLSEQSVYKILMKSNVDGHSPNAFLSEVNELISDLVNVTFCNANVPLLEFSSLSIDKGKTLSKYANSIGIEREFVIAFGDNINDFSMFDFAGHSWVISGGHPEGVNRATYVAPSLEEDGVAVVLEEIFGLNVFKQ